MKWFDVKKMLGYYGQASFTYNYYETSFDKNIINVYQ